MKGKFAKQHGLTLIELITAVAIISILAALALPAYDSYTRKSVRAAAKSELEKISALMETYYVNNKTCTNDLTNLGYSTSTAYVDKTGNEVASTSSNRAYAISATCTANTRTYALTATPQLGQADDSDCMNFTLNYLGQKNASGPKGTKCW